MTLSVGENGDHVAAIEYVINTVTFGIVAGVSASGLNAVGGGALKQFVSAVLNLETIFSGIAFCSAILRPPRKALRSVSVP